MTSMTSQTPAWRGVGCIAELTFLEFARRKDAYVMGILMGLFAIATVVTRMTGIENTATARLLMSSGLALSHLCAAILMAAFCGRLFPEEFEQRTLLTLLAKPVSRGGVFVGRIGTSIALVLGAYIIFVLMTLLTAPRVEGQAWLTLIEAMVLEMTSLAMLGLLVGVLSLYMSAIVAILVALLWYFGFTFSLNLLGDVLESWPLLQTVLMRILRSLPDAGLFSHAEAFVNKGTGIGFGYFMSILTYGIAWCMFILIWAFKRFERIRL